MRLGIALALLAAIAGSVPAATPEAVIAGTGERIDAMFRAETGKPLKRAKKRPPLPGKNRGNFVRAYSYSMMAFAARCFYLGENLDEANSALVENAQHYLDNPLDVNDRDSFHWHAEIVMRLIEHYGTNGDKVAGRLTPATEAQVLKPIWIYAKHESTLKKADFKTSKTWHLYGSENHHAMDFTTNWHFAKLAKDRPEYQNRKYDDGATAADHFRAWNAYIIEYCKERARKGICVEMASDGYNVVWGKGFYNFYDFGPQKLKQCAGMLLDLYFAYWAQEQINGHMGGGGSRIKGNNPFKQIRHHANATLAWYYFGMGKSQEVSGTHLNAALSDYRPPPVVADLALDSASRGTYEVRQRTQGLGKVISNEPKVTALRTDGGGILRYTYCTPAFIMGTVMTTAHPNEDWAPVSSQSRWQGVAFAGEHDARLVPLVRAKNNREAYNTQWSVQSKGTLITQKLEGHKGGAEMMVWFAKEGLSNPVQENGIVFVEAEYAFAAARSPGSRFSLEEKVFTGKRKTGNLSSTPPGWVMSVREEFAPVIVEVMPKSQVVDFAAFKAKVKAAKLKVKDSVVHYQSIYGDSLTFDLSYKTVPTINGTPVDYAPPKVFESPFLNADYNAGVVTISKGSRNRTLDFNNGEVR